MSMRQDILETAINTALELLHAAATDCSVEDVVLLRRAARLIGRSILREHGEPENIAYFSTLNLLKRGDVLHEAPYSS